MPTKQVGSGAGGRAAVTDDVVDPASLARFFGLRLASRGTDDVDVEDDVVDELTTETASSGRS